MAFWGIEVKPGKPTPLNLTRRLVVKQAALVVNKPSKKPEPCVLSIEVAEEEQRFVVCRLHEGVLEQCPMELPFSPGDEAKVHLTGAHPVHLTGFLELDDEDDLEDMDEIDELDKLEEEEDAPAGKKQASGKAAPAANVGKGKAVPENMKDDDSEEESGEEDGEEDGEESGEEDGEESGEEDAEDDGEDSGEEGSGEEMDDEESGEEESEEEEEAPRGKRAAPVAAQSASKKAKPSTPAKPGAAAAATPSAKSAPDTPGSGPNTWSEAEDAKLQKALTKHGPDVSGRWEKVAAIVGSRSSAQCKKRAKAISKA